VAGPLAGLCAVPVPAGQATRRPTSWQAEAFTLRAWISDRERTVADAFRLRHLTGEDLAFAALRRYLQSRPRLARLAEAARPLRAWSALSAALRILQS